MRGNQTVDPSSGSGTVRSGRVEQRRHLYTTGASLSSQIASRRHSAAILAATDYRGKRRDRRRMRRRHLHHRALRSPRPASIYAFDPASKAIDVARKKAAGMDITFEVNIAYDIPCADNSFDIAHVRNVLHHMDRPVDALRERSGSHRRSWCSSPTATTWG